MLSKNKKIIEQIKFPFKMLKEIFYLHGKSQRRKVILFIINKILLWKKSNRKHEYGEKDRTLDTNFL